MKKILIALLLLTYGLTYGQNLPSVSSTATIQVNNNGTVGTATPAQIVAAGGTGAAVTAVSVATANGFNGSATATTTPVITIGTSLSTGIIPKSNGTGFVASTAGTDYSAGTSTLGTGILKSTTGTGNLTIATAGDFPTLNQNTTGTSANVTGVVAPANGGLGASSLTGYLFGNGAGAATASSTIPTTALSGTVTNAQLTNSTIITATNTTGSDISLNTPVALGGILMLSVPDASSTARGAVTVGNQTIGSTGTTKTFAGNTTTTELTTATGGLTSSGQRIHTSNSLSATTILTTASNEFIIADATSAAFTITLPTTPTTGTTYKVVKKNVTTNAVTLAAGGSNTINGLATLVLYTGKITYRLIFDGADWNITQ